MIINQLYTERLTSDTVKELVRKGKVPSPETVKAVLKNVAVPPLFIPPPVERGEVSDPAQWEKALVALEKDLDLAEKAVSSLVREKSNKWTIVENKMSRLELYAHSVEQLILNGGKGLYVDTFSNINGTEIVGNNSRGIPGTTCEVDLQNRIVVLGQTGDACSKKDISRYQAYWFLQTKGNFKQSGHIQNIVLEKEQAWCLEVESLKYPVELKIRVESDSPVVANSLYLKVSGVFCETRVFVNGMEASRLNNRAWFFPEQEIKEVEVFFLKDMPDSDYENVCYFSIQEISLYQKNYQKSGVYVTRPVQIEGAECRPEVSLTLPPETKAGYYLGLENSNTVKWIELDLNSWFKLPTVNVKQGVIRPEDRGYGEEIYPGIFRLTRLSDYQVKNFKLDVGEQMWLVQSGPTTPGAQPVLEEWINTKYDQISCLPCEDGFITTGSRIYRLYAAVTVPREIIIRDWRPTVQGHKIACFVNHVPQKTTGAITLYLNKGLNHIEFLVVSGEEDAYFAPNLYLGDVITRWSVLPKPAAAVTGYALQYNYPAKQLDVYAVENNFVLVNYDPKKIGNMRCACSYILSTTSSPKARLMVTMHTENCQVSPVMDKLSLQWR